jgi:photosystem II stability/assembly factor-like uncharacterized protein
MNVMSLKRISFLTLPMIFLLSCMHKTEKQEFMRKPVDEMFAQRAYPHGDIPFEAFSIALDQALNMRSNSKRDEVAWNFAGPLNMGGRLSAVEVHPSQPGVIYAGAASGGVFRTVNGGASWQPIFDNAHVLSVGDIAIAPSNPQTIYVGTGEANAGGGSLAYDGYGIYRSDDGGENWQHLGLTASGSIGRIAVHPTDPETVYVAAMGRLFANNSERGLYKTNDGGQNWEQLLFVNDSTGAVDVLVHPLNPETVFAVTWERVRRPHRRSYGGQGCGIWKSIDGGQNWTKLQLGLPTGQNVGRIGISMCESAPETLYAIYADRTGYFDGVYKTTNGGNSWTRTNDGTLGGMYSSFGWWFGRIYADPANPNTVYALGLDMFKSTDGGNSWVMTTSGVHVDQHDLVILPQNTNTLYLGNDGGLYTSVNGGSGWTHNKFLPVTQFYTCEIDEQKPERLYGGAQDLGTLRTLTGQFGDWYTIYGGDGFRVLVDPTDNNFVYAEYQYGGFARSVNGGLSFSQALNGINSNDRKNWHTPVVFNPLNPKSLYLGANRLYKTTQRAILWQAISSDLTKGPGGGNLVYGTISCIEVSKADTNVIYVGTDDGKVWVTQDEGSQWTDISAGLPNRWVTTLSSRPENPAIIYVGLSGYRYDSYIPHILKSENYGLNWTDISAGLPEVPVNNILADPLLEGVLYVATDFGMYYTTNDGQEWNVMGSGLPNVPITDLRLYEPERKLLCATYGRSMYSINLDELTGFREINHNLTTGLKAYYLHGDQGFGITLETQNAANVQLTLTDLSGKVLAVKHVGASLSGNKPFIWNPGIRIKPGIYIIAAQSPDQKNVAVKVVVSHQ